MRLAYLKPASSNKTNEDQLIKILIVIAAGLVVMNFINQLLGEPQRLVTRMIDLDTEANFPTWFSSALLAIAAFFAYQASVLAGPDRGRRLWQVLIVIFLLMSCDEVAMIHESVGSYFVNHITGIRQLKISPWLVVLCVPSVAIASILARKVGLYLKLRKTRICLGIGLLCFFAGAFLLEATLGFMAFPKLAKIHWIWLIEKDLEEGLEMFGVILMIYGLLEHCKFLRNGQEIVNMARVGTEDRLTLPPSSDYMQPEHLAVGDGQ